MTPERARFVFDLVRDGVLFAITVAREVSKEVVRSIRARRVVIRDERGVRDGVHGR